VRDPYKARPPKGARLGKFFQRGKARLTERNQRADRISRESFGIGLREFGDGDVNDAAALGGARFGIDRIERTQAQHVFGVNRIGIAQPVLDLSDGEAFWSRRARRGRRGLRCRRNALRPVQFLRPCQIPIAAGDDFPPAAAGQRREALDKTRGHRGRSLDLGGAAQHHLGCVEQLREVVSAQPDAAFRQIEPKRKPHPPAEPGIGMALRRPLALDQSAEHDAVAVGKPGFEQTENAHPRTGPGGLTHGFSAK